MSIQTTDVTDVTVMHVARVSTGPSYFPADGIHWYDRVVAGRMPLSLHLQIEGKLAGFAEMAQLTVSMNAGLWTRDENGIEEELATKGLFGENSPYGDGRSRPNTYSSHAEYVSKQYASEYGACALVNADGTKYAVLPIVVEGVTYQVPLCAVEAFIPVPRGWTLHIPSNVIRPKVVKGDIEFKEWGSSRGTQRRMSAELTPGTKFDPEWWVAPAVKEYELSPVQRVFAKKLQKSVRQAAIKLAFGEPEWK